MKHGAGSNAGLRAAFFQETQLSVEFLLSRLIQFHSFSGPLQTNSDVYRESRNIAPFRTDGHLPGQKFAKTRRKKERENEEKRGGGRKKSDTCTVLCCHPLPV